MSVERNKHAATPWPVSLFLTVPILLGLSMPGYAQDSAAQTMEEVVVTGSKLRRDEFSSISPVQVIGGREAIQIGISDTTQMIAESPVVTGTQLDGSVNAGSTTGAVEGVPASGPGAATVALRGLGAERTLLLVNGRRLAPSGVRGAPVAPDLNLIPSAMIDRIEILTDGASSIYGADAVAGVVNIMLRNNFEGAEVNGFTSQPSESGGEESLVNVVGGATGDRGNFTVAAEYFERDHVMARERTDWNSCLLDIETDPGTGDRYSVCQDRRPDNAVFIGSQGFIFRTPGTTDLGVPGYSSNAAAANSIGRPGTNALLGSAAETPYNLQQEELDTQLQGNIKRANLYATGHYEYVSGHRAYMETSYSQRRNTDIFTSEQAFPGIPATIPRMDVDGNVIAMVDNPLNPFDEDALPVNTLSSLTQRRRTDIDNFRIVLGGDGELPIEGLADRNWIYDLFVSWEESSGTSVQAGMLEPHVRESIDTLRVDSDGNLVCGLERTALSFGFLTPAECVPVNWFADSLFSVTGGSKRFSQEEEDFLFGNVINTTNLEQIHMSGLVTGDLFEMPAGMVGLVLGMEWRENSIDSANDIVRAQALSASEAPDQEADTVGETSIFDFYAETELPLTNWALLNLSGRYTDEENFGDEFTYSVKGQIEPTQDLRFRATYGTTFRAPNLREQFLAGQAGVIAGENDPCIVPLTARTGGVYDPDGDTRSQRVLDNCQQDGVDPTALGLQANVLIPTETGGSEDIGAETSESFTVGFVWTQSFTDAFDLDLSATYFDIEVEDTVEELEPTTILARCYNDDPNLENALCSRVERRGVNPENNTVSRVDSSFVNLGLVTSKGVDLNVRYLDDFSIGNRLVEMTWLVTGSYYNELKEQVDPASPVDDRVGEAGFPEWSWLIRGNFTMGNWSASWRSRFIGEFARDAEDVVASDNRPGLNACIVLGGPANCVKTHSGDSVWYHDAALSYEAGSWTIAGGIRNLLDENPPLIDQGQGPARMNHVVQSTYDLYGRRFFLNATRRF